MVSTRHHPRDFPPPSTPSPSTPSKNTHSNNTTTNRSSARSSRRRSSSAAWSHTPSHLTLIWLLFSVPLVLWDTAYVFLRPHSMTHGALHWPLFVPYKLYATVDYIYGLPAWEEGNGFTMAQAVVNLLESSVYAAYLWIVWRAGRESAKVGRGAPGRELVTRIGGGETAGWLRAAREVTGRDAAWACVLGFGGSLATVCKTVLYALNECFSSFHNIGHNSWTRIIFLWVIPNGLWLILPTFILTLFTAEIVEGLEMATEGARGTSSRLDADGATKEE
ncbi:MAG: hypothetical protein M1817_004776 [Caeruleum heppii]|nr:MAG: hypothetical protein M1817_004776 [Caeruleum heppii]